MNIRTMGLPAVFVIIALLAMAGCAHLQKPVSVSPAPGPEVMNMTAQNFKFTPNNIDAREGDVIVFRIRNISSTLHNFTLKNPDGKKIAEADLPPGKTTEIKASFPRPGSYEFYCDKDSHALLGMKGRVEVSKR